MTESVYAHTNLDAMCPHVHSHKFPYRRTKNSDVIIIIIIIILLLFFPLYTIIKLGHQRTSYNSVNKNLTMDLEQ